MDIEKQELADQVSAALNGSASPEELSSMLSGGYVMYVDQAGNPTSAQAESARLFVTDKGHKALMDAPAVRITSGRDPHP